MKTKLSMAKAIGCAAAIAVSGTASAALFTPPAGVPLYIKLGNAEQICTTGNCITPPSGPSAISLPTGLGLTEQNWGILNITQILGGDINSPNDPYLYPDDGVPLWNTSTAAKITGIFYGVQDFPTSNNQISSTSGFIDLWYDDTSLANTLTGTLANATPSLRTGVNAFAGWTDGIFLGRIAYAPGIDSLGNPSVNIIGTIIPSAPIFTGVADSYGDVIDVDGIAGIGPGDGAWAALMDGDYFPVLIDDDLNPVTPMVQEKRDFRFKNSYNQRPNWDGPAGSGILGAVSDDPARVFTVPEPGSLALMGLGLIGAGLATRRRK